MGKGGKTWTGGEEAGPGRRVEGDQVGKEGRREVAGREATSPLGLVRKRRQTWAPAASLAPPLSVRRELLRALRHQGPRGVAQT